MSLFFGSTNSYFVNSPNIAPNSTVDRYKLWAKARTGVDPGLRPSLDLNFAANKSLVDEISGLNLVTFSRATGPATYVGADGLIKSATTNEARFDHNPLTGECLGLLVEEQRTNLILKSEDFTSGSGTWQVSFGTVTANAGVAPDGNTTADLISQGRVERYDITYNASTTYTFSVYVKGTAGQTIGIGKFVNGSDADVVLSYNTLNGSWQRFSYTFTSPITVSGSRVVISGANDKSGTATNFYIWGAQLEVGSFPTSYIPTSGSTATRVADQVSITGSNFSRWYNQNEGTAFVQTRNIKSADYSQASIIGFDGSGGLWNNIQEWGVLYYDSTKTFASMVYDSSSGPYLIINLADTRSSARVAMGLNTTSAALSVNGNINQVSRTGGTMPSINSLLFYNSGNNPRQSTQFSRFTYWNRRLPNSNLQSMTQ